MLWLLAACGGASDEGGGDATSSTSPTAAPTDTAVASRDTVDSGRATGTTADTSQVTLTAHTGATATTGSTAATADSAPLLTGDTAVGCRYPAGAVEPMAEGEVLTPHTWPVATHMDGRFASLELGKVPCNDDDDIDWSPFDILLFVSIPAW